MLSQNWSLINQHVRMFSLNKLIPKGNESAFVKKVRPSDLTSEIHWRCQFQCFSVLYQKPLTWLPNKWKMRLERGWNMQHSGRNVRYVRKYRICHRTMQIYFPTAMTPFIVSPLTCHKHSHTDWLSSLFSRFSFESSELTSSPRILDVATARASTSGSRGEREENLQFKSS